MADVDSIIKGLQDDFRTGNYSDMRLTDGDGNVYNVHKVVLCHQSQFFENAMKEGRFREGYENTIHLEDKGPGVVLAMLQYFYHGDFDYPRDDMSFVEKILFEIDLWALADEYIIRSLVNHVVSRLNSDMSAGLNHVPEQMKSAFPRFVLAVYGKTHEPGSFLRFMIVGVAMDHVPWLLKQEEFQQLIVDMPKFTQDLMLRQAISRSHLRAQVGRKGYIAPADGSK